MRQSTTITFIFTG